MINRIEYYLLTPNYFFTKP